MYKVCYVAEDIVNAGDFDEKVVKEGTKLESTKTFPQAVNKFFVGWFYDEDYTMQVEYPITVDEDITLYAKFIEGNLPERNIAFDEDGQEYFVTSITLPKNLKAIGKHAFEGCSALAELIFQGDNADRIMWEKSNKEDFSENTSNINLVDAEQNADWFSETVNYYNYYWRKVEA